MQDPVALSGNCPAKNNSGPNLYCLGSRDPSCRVFFSAKINGKPYASLADSGADITLMSEST